MRRLKPFWFFLAFAAILYVLAFGIHSLVNQYLDKPATGTSTSCNRLGQDHLVIIKNSLAVPEHTNAKRCDTLTIKNTDSQIRLVAFGVHDNHRPYDGITEKVLDKNQTFTVTLNQAGTFKFHDHLDNSAQGTFSVR